jgi:prolyl oligopeptidase
MPTLRSLPAAVLLLNSLSFAQTGPPVAHKQPVVNEYHGVKVSDDYRWLEDWSNPETRAWSDAENAYARRYLDALPGREHIHQQITDLLAKPSASFRSLRRCGGPLFAIRSQPPKQQPFLVRLPSLNDPDSAVTILDPAQLDPSGQTAIDFYVPSPNGTYVAVSLSKGGSESGDVSVYETGTGNKLSDAISRVNGGTAGGSVAWNADSSGFYYTRYPRAGERPPADLDFYQQIWFHRLGANSSTDRYSLGKDFPRIAEIALKSSEDGTHILATMANGDGGEFAHYLLGPDGNWVQIAHLADQITSATFGTDGFLYLLSRKNAPEARWLNCHSKMPISPMPRP